MMNFRPGVAAIAVAIAAVTLGSTVQAQPVKVRYSDLNLASSSGRAALDRRIEVAARQMCGTAQSLAESVQVRRCQSEAFESVKATVSRLVLDATSPTAGR